MQGCTNDYSANMTVSDFIAGVEKFVWDIPESSFNTSKEYTLYETLEELTSQFRRVSEAEQFAADLAIQAANDCITCGNITFNYSEFSRMLILDNTSFRIS